MEDNAIIDLFFVRSEDAIKELDNKYGRFCRRLSYSILRNDQDVEECVNDAYLGMWNAIPPVRPDPLLPFLRKIIYNLSLMRYHTNKAIKRDGGFVVAFEDLEGCLVSPYTVEKDMEEKELLRLIEDFINTLAPENRIIMVRRYWFSDSYKRISEQTGLSEKNISVRLARIKKKLRTYLSERGGYADGY